MKVEGPLGGEGLLPGDAEATSTPRDSYLHRGALPETPGLTWGAGWGTGAGGRGQSSLAGRGRGATRSPDHAGLTSLGRAGARSAGVAWPGNGGRSWWAPCPPARVRSRRDLFTPRPAAAAAATGGGGDRPLVPAVAVANRRAACK